jgi:predicted RNase H-like nuclease
MLKAATYWDACQIGAATDGRKLSQQCWNIVSKIKEVDNYVLARADGQSRVREVHPEVSFWALAGQPMAFPKRKRPGRQERIKTLEPLFGESIGGALAASRQMGAQPDDVLDAFVALWSAERIYRGNPRRLPKAVELDSQGLRMEILA